MKVCFYANVDPEQIAKIEFYNNDLRILHDLGHDVEIATTARDVLATRDVDLFYVWWWNRALFPIAMSRRLHAKTIVCGVFDYFLPYPTKHDYVSRPYWQRWMMRKALALADANVFICNYEYDLVRRMMQVNAPHMIYLAIDSGIYQEKVEQPSGKLLLNIAWSGEENTRRKGLVQIIEAMPRVLDQHPDARLIMAGRNGPALPALKQRASALGVASAIEFLGEVDVTEKVRLMQRATLYLQPSMYEGFGSAVAEAMACGTPAACTMTGSLPEVMGQTGVQISTPTAASIAQSVNHFLSLPAAEQSRMNSEAARRVRSTFSYEQRKAQLAAVITSVTSSGRT